MRSMFRPLTLALFSMLSLACNRGSDAASDGGKPTAEVTPASAAKLVGAPAPAVPEPTAKLLAAVGEGAPAVVVLRDEAIATLNERLPKLLPAPALAEMAELTGAVNGVDVLAKLAETLDLPVRKAELKGRDPARPIVVSAFESPVSGPPGMAVALMPVVDGHQLPLRHQVVLPAKDVTALLGSMRAWLPAEDTIERPELVKGLEGAVGLELKRRWPLQTFIALVPEDGHLRVVLLHEGRGIDSASELRSLVDVKVGDLSDTPALRHAGRDEHALAVLVRPWHLRSLGVWTGLNQTMLAVDTVGPDQRWMAMTRGTAITATAEVLSPDDQAEFDDWSFAMSADADSLRLTSVASLTPTGRKIWDAAATKPVAAPRLRKEVDASLTVALDIAAALGEAKGHTLREGSLGDLARTFQNCGVTCPMFSALRWPASAVRTLAPEVSRTGTGVASAQLVMPSSSEPARVAVALVGDDLPAAEVLKGAVGVLARPGAAAKVEEGTHAGHPALLVGNGIEPATIFELGAESPEPPALLRAQGRLPAELGGGSLRSAMHRAGPALTFELVFGPGKLRSLLDYSAATWDSPLGSGEATKASRCLHELAWVLVDDVNSIAMVAVDQRATTAVTAAGKIGPLVTCAAEDPQLAEAARGLASLMTATMAGALLEVPDYRAARAVLQTGCPEGRSDGPACERLAAMADVAIPTLQQFSVPEQCRPEYDPGFGMPVVVNSDGIFIAGRKVAASSSAIAAAVVEQMSMDGRSEKVGSTLALWVEGSLPFSVVEPVVAAAASLDSELGAVINDESGKAMRVGWAREWPKTVSIDWKVDPTYVPEKRFGGGLYDPEERAPGSTGPKVSHTLLQTRGGLVVVPPGGTTLAVPNSSALSAYVDAEQSAAGPGRTVQLTWKVAPDVPWSEVAEVLTQTCTIFGAVVQTPAGTP